MILLWQILWKGISKLKPMHIVVPRIPTLFSPSSILDSGMIYNIKALTTFWSSSVFLLYHPCVSPGCLSVRRTHTVPLGSQEMVSDPLDPERQTFESHRVGSRSWTQVLWKSRVCSKLRALSPASFFFWGGDGGVIVFEMFYHYFSLPV